MSEKIGSQALTAFVPWPLGGLDGDSDQAPDYERRIQQRTLTTFGLGFAFLE